MKHQDPNLMNWNVSKAETLKRRVDMWKVTCEASKCRHECPKL